MKANDKIFVYGSLRPGAHAYHLMVGGSKPVSLAALYGASIYDFGPFPGLKLTKSHNDMVVGHLLEITDKSLPDRLDQYEGYPQYYSREQVNVTREDGEVVKAWVYTFNGEVNEITRIVSGDWLQRAGKQEVA